MSESDLNTEKLIGVEVSKSALKAVSLTANGELTGEFESVVDAERETFAQIVEFIVETKNRFGDFQRIGIAVPGLVQRQTKRVAFSTYIPEHETIDFLSRLEIAAGARINVENDANAAAIGEYALGAGRGSRSLFYVTLGTGIGGAFVFDGAIWRGANGFAGEFGHMTINSEGMKLEEVASAANIVRRIRNRFHQDSTSSLSRFDEEKITLSDVVRAAQKGDDFAQMMLERTGTFVGTAIANVINLLNVEKIIVGGEIMQAENVVLEAIAKRAKELSFAPSFEGTQIVEGKLGANAAAIGAALLANTASE